MSRIHVWISGVVQGVGFRFRTHEIASHYNVEGYVKNLFDGKVELWVEGERDEVDAMLKEIANRMANNIRGVDISELPPTGKKGFRIAYE